MVSVYSINLSSVTSLSRWASVSKSRRKFLVEQKEDYVIEKIKSTNKKTQQLNVVFTSVTWQKTDGTNKIDWIEEWRNCNIETTWPTFNSSASMNPLPSESYSRQICVCVYVKTNRWDAELFNEQFNVVSRLLLLAAALPNSQPIWKLFSFVFTFMNSTLESSGLTNLHKL